MTGRYGALPGRLRCLGEASRKWGLALPGLCQEGPGPPPGIAGRLFCLSGPHAPPPCTADPRLCRLSALGPHHWLGPGPSRRAAPPVDLEPSSPFFRSSSGAGLARTEFSAEERRRPELLQLWQERERQQQQQQQWRMQGAERPDRWASAAPWQWLWSPPAGGVGPSTSLQSAETMWAGILSMGLWAHAGTAEAAVPPAR